MKKWYEKNPEIKEKLSKIAKKQWENPEERKEMSKIKKKYYEENPETAQIHSERMKKYSENPKVKEIFGKRMKKWYEENQHHGWKGGGEYAPFDTYAEQLDYAEDVRNNDNKLEVRCAYCGKWYIPKVGSVQHRITALNNKGYGEARLYCSEGCKISCPVYNQHLWPKGFKIGTSREVQPELRQMVLARDNYICQKCGVTESLHCHHKEGIRWEPIESADIDMCITFCKDCHKEVHKIEGCGYYEMRCVNE